MKIELKLLPLEWLQDFTKIWSSVLLFDPTHPIFEFVRDIFKINILSKFDEDWVKIVASRVVTRFYKDLT